MKTLRGDIQAIFDRDPAARNTLEVLFLYPGLHALWLHRLAHAFWRNGFTFLGRLVDRGDTLVVIEHHPSVIAAADHVVELGPEGGEEGGLIVAQGTPRELSRVKTATGRVLKALFSQGEARKARISTG